MKIENYQLTLITIKRFYHNKDFANRYIYANGLNIYFKINDGYCEKYDFKVLYDTKMKHLLSSTPHKLVISLKSK